MFHALDTLKAATILTALAAMVLSVSATSEVLAAGKVTTVAAPGGARPICARIDSRGTIHLVCDSPHGPQYARSTDGGQTFEAAIPVVDRESRRPGLEFLPWDMAVAPDGRVHVALGTNAWKLKLPKQEWGFHYASLAPGGKAFSPVRNINRTPSEGYSLAVGEKGNVTACWLSDKLYANVSHDGGETFGDNIEIDSSFNPCNCCTTSAAYGADGRLAILYREETDNDRDMYLVLWDQQRTSVSRARVSGTSWHLDACPMTYYAVVPRGDGYLAVWPTKGQIYFARLDAQGKLLPPGEIMTPGTTGIRTGMVALSGADGETLIAWKKDGRLGWQLYDADGHPQGRRESASSPGNGAAGVVDNDGNFILFR